MHELEKECCGIKTAISQSRTKLTNEKGRPIMKRKSYYICVFALLAIVLFAGCAKSPQTQPPQAEPAQAEPVQAEPAQTKLPQDDEDAVLKRFDGIRESSYTEIFLMNVDPQSGKLVGGVYNTVGLNSKDGSIDSSPRDISFVDAEALKREFEVLGVHKNGPRLWTLDWLEVMVGKEQDFNGLKARWVMWLDVPKELTNKESTAYKNITGKRDTQLGINAGTRVYILDDPEGNSWVMKSAGLIVDPTQTYVNLKDLGSRLKPVEGWKFRTIVLDKDLILTPDNGVAHITQDELGNTYDRVGGAFSNYKP